MYACSVVPGERHHRGGVAVGVELVGGKWAGAGGQEKSVVSMILVPRGVIEDVEDNLVCVQQV